MKFLVAVFFTLLSLSAVAGFEGKQDGTSLKVFNKIDCSTGLTCTRTGNGDFTMTADASGALIESDVTAQDEGLNIGRLAIFDYDFAVDGGAVSTIASGVSLPAKAVIEKCWFRIETQIVDAGAGTLAVQCEDANNILSAADQSGVAAGAFLASAITGTAATMVDDIAASCDISFVIGGAAISAGKLRGYCRYSVHE
jgi:hypothetical protein